jgi:cell wall assembly regulator SMI1
MSQIMDITKSFQKILAWISNHTEDINLRPPADPAAILNLTEKSGLSLPEDLHQVLSIADGERRSSAGMIGNWRLMAIAEIQAAWGLLTKLAEKSAFNDQEAQTPVYIRDKWWDESWIPFVTSDSGDYFCLDMNPPETTHIGQVLLFFKDQPDRPLIAGSLSAWFDRIARDLEAGLYIYDGENGFNGEAFMWSALQNKHLFDGIQGKLIT